MLCVCEGTYRCHLHKCADGTMLLNDADLTAKIICRRIMSFFRFGELGAIWQGEIYFCF
jgi:hypothetical protein